MFHSAIHDADAFRDEILVRFEKQLIALKSSEQSDVGKESSLLVSLLLWDLLCLDAVSSAPSGRLRPSVRPSVCVAFPSRVANRGF